MAQRSFMLSATGPAVPRVDATSGTTTGSPTVTDTAAAAFDVGKAVSGAGIPAGSYVISVVPGVSFTMSANATATASVSVTVGSLIDAGAGNNYRNFGLKVTSAVQNCVVALETSPDNTTWTEQDRVTGPSWSYVALHHSRRYARANVINLGTGATPVAAVVTYTI